MSGYATEGSQAIAWKIKIKIKIKSRALDKIAA